MDKWIERIMVALGIFLGIPLFISAAILFWAVALALIGVVLGQLSVLRKSARKIMRKIK